MSHLEPVLCFALLYEDWLQHIIDLLRGGVLAIPHPNAGQQNEFLHPLLGSCLYEVDVALCVCDNNDDNMITTR